MLSYFLIIRHFIQREVRVLYPTKASVLTHAIGEFVTVVLYWYTAKALAPKVEFQDNVGPDYFAFILIGELTLLIPTTLLYNYTKSIKQMVATKTLDYLIVQPYSQVRFLISSGTPVVAIRFFQMLVTLIILYSFFSFSLPLSVLLKILFVILLSLPIFIGLGLLGASVVIRWGRGEQIIMMLSSASYIVAGVYFPTGVFPKTFESIVNNLSPFNVLLGAVRKLSIINSTSPIGQELIVLLGMGGLFMVAGYGACSYAFSSVIKRKKPLIF